MTEGRDQRTDDRGQRAEGRDQRTEVRGPFGTIRDGSDNSDRLF